MTSRPTERGAALRHLAPTAYAVVTVRGAPPVYANDAGPWGEEIRAQAWRAMMNARRRLLRRAARLAVVGGGDAA